MPRRPLPNIPRGPRRAKADRPPARLLGCPRVSPEWELSALRALIKPQLKGAILHRNGNQRWTRSTQRAVERAVKTLRDRLGSDISILLPASGDYHFIADVPDANADDVRAWAVVLSKSVPELWLVAGRLFVKNGKFFRRQYGYKLWLVPANDVHLPRALRSVLQGCL